jgi:hypothetical protein
MTQKKAEKESGKRVYLANQNINGQINFLDLHVIRTRVSKPSAWNTSQIPADLQMQSASTSNNSKDKCFDRGKSVPCEEQAW